MTSATAADTLALEIKSPLERSFSPLTTARPKAAFVLDEASCDVIYSPRERAEIAQLLDVVAVPMGRKALASDADALRDVEIILSGWGAPIMDQAFLDAAPRLRAIFYGAGSTRYFISPEFWEREIILSSAYAANAIPVAEYALGTILLSLKHFWNFATQVRQGRGWEGDHLREVPGVFRSTVGLISFGVTARRLLKLLKPFDLRILVYCPFLTEAEASELGVERALLNDVFRQSDVVSIHTPMLPETKGMIDGKLISLMKPGATLINTSRGPVIDQSALTKVLKTRRDLTAVLDVCDPEPCPLGDPLLELPNVVLTPHIAGSLGPECHRLGAYTVAELKRYLNGEPLQWQITPEMFARMA